MGVPGNANALLLASAAVSGGYQVSRSLRFNSADSANCTRTAGSPTASGTWTFSVWVKRAKIGIDTAIFGGRSGGSATQVYFKSDNTLRWYEDTADFSTTAVFRDTSAWYHFVFTKNGTTSCTVYVNGVQLQQNTTSVPSTSRFNTSSAELFIGAIGLIPSGVSFYGDHYLANIEFVDGSAKVPGDFAETDATTGQWIPKLYSGSYGSNGFKLSFSDNSTTAALGTDTSGNGNTWTVNNLSVTAGSGNDSLVDTPTSYGTDTGVGNEVRGNYCTLNPLDNSSGMTLANGNLDGSETGGGHKGTRSTIKFPASGKWYYEGTVTTLGGACCIGAATNAAANPDINAAGSYYILVNSSGNVQRYQSFASYTGFDTPAVGTILRVAYDADAQKLWLGLNGLWMNSSTGTTGDPATGANATFSSITDIYPAIDQQTSAVAVNFGQRAFAYTAPSGFKALVDTNLPAPVVAKPNTVMDVKLYTGNGGTQSITGLNFNPDFVWLKSRSSGSYSHNLYDAVRGATKILYSDSTSSENTDANGLTAFNSDGFSLGSTAATNASSTTYVGWAWDAGTSTVTNTAGSITSQVRANASAGFSVVTYTGNGSNATVGHGLGIAPSMTIVKVRNRSGDNWLVYHKSLSTPATDYLLLSATSASGTLSGYWNGGPTSSVIGLGNYSAINNNGDSYVAYSFAPVSGYSSFGTYVGTGSGEGSFVYTGFKPKWVMCKRSDSTGNWVLVDGVRTPYNVINTNLYPNASNAEDNGFQIDSLSNGFKVRSSGTDGNASGGTYIFAAFAESPFQYSRAR